MLAEDEDISIRNDSINKLKKKIAPSIIEITNENKYYETVEKYSWIYELWRWADKHNIECIPRNKNKLESLEELDLSNLELADIPEELMWLTNLKKISFSNNCLSEFPYCILNLENLEILDLSQNNLTEIPDDICYLEKLYSINLNENHFKKIPDCLKNKIFYQHDMCSE